MPIKTGTYRGRGGFTLVECLIVAAIVGILAMLAVPSFSSAVAGFQLRSAGKAMVGLMQQARLRAGNSQKPARAVIDCRAHLADRLSPCEARLYAATFNENGELNGWLEISGTRRDFDPSVSVSAAAGAVALGTNPNGLFWAVFLPSGRVTGSHDVMRLVFSSDRGVGQAWELDLGLNSGSIALRRV
ncbi:MAG: prepilin-type N-terminal cleavage/methylation domain-containing protein [Candidatus Adiutrix sp.]|jgi:prepilin-type N-terminal cleavage/methylation domain-containing protein|nr:prepilin-type N-terminal cleavage/methylation domain-containing protein [Candidatus Adiutrix sp.]